MADGGIRRLALWAVFAAFVLAQAVLAARLIAIQPLGFDFAPLWTALRLVGEGRLDALYDFQAVTAAQQWLTGETSKTRPFVNPPTYLLFAPLGQLPFPAAYGLWAAASLAAFLAATARAFGWRAALLALATPAVGLVMLIGQSSLVVGALVLVGLKLRQRPLLAGLALAFAAAIKPQLLVLAPFALAAERRWGALLICGAAGLALCLISAAVFGAGPWIAWFDALQRFHRLIAADPSLLAEAVTPASLLVAWHAPQAALLACQILSLAGGAAAVWAVFRRSEDLAVRSIAVIGMGLLASPYAMAYELAMLAPALACLALRVDRRLWLAAFGSYLLLVMVVPGPLALALILALSLGPLAASDSRASKRALAAAE